ncbi:metabolite traffic protein EboE [Streptomyces sp. AP-93]|uniref:metabolite traffic protein EboE n=1 Tax=Streptomyces sp. AP-93 TaxID=2929048 RepID=UPI001FAED485|nr:metabolite traffic protein EboE [Streptomyces sp. AP-93]MCJ0871840.1 metabolite traffic protein EboE [Streptomyces sp. AP-93]
MRFRHRDGTTVHLSYSTTVHPAETLDGLLAQLGAYCEPVRRRLGLERLGIGLWLAADAVRALDAGPRALAALRGDLDRRGLEVVTLNGYPYQGFGGERVKYRVYRPDWAQAQRYEHTLALARILAALLPEDAAEGTISTLPLAWRTVYDDERAARARTALAGLGARLDDLADATGRSIRIALEPEPGCAVETTAEAIAPLRAIGHDRIGICVDTCHLATSFEEPGPALAALAEAGVPVVKSQLSAALHAEHPGRPEVRAALADFAACGESRFLHQTRTPAADGLRGTDDLGPALAGGALPEIRPWRALFHVPLHATPAAPLTTTLPVVNEALAHLVGGERALTGHLEVETYAWQALPPALRPRTAEQLVDAVAAELALARDLLTEHGLKELP